MHRFINKTKSSLGVLLLLSSGCFLIDEHDIEARQDGDDDGVPAYEDCDDDDPKRFAAQPWYADSDNDGFGSSEAFVSACEAPQGHVSNADDCDDDDLLSYPGADELCDQVDNDCDLAIDENAVDQPTWYRDNDGDGYGTQLSTMQACEQPEGFAPWDGDCDDQDNNASPGTQEACDGTDNDCDEQIDEDEEVLGDGPACNALSCQHIQSYRTEATSGVYWLKTTNTVPFKAYCNLDKTYDDGGWTLSIVVSDDQQSTWRGETVAYWDLNPITFGTLSELNMDFKSRVHHDLPFTSLLFLHQPSGVWATYDVGTGSRSLAEVIAGYDGVRCWSSSDGYPLRSGTLTQDGTLCNTRLFFNCADHDGSATCAGDDHTYGPCWNTTWENHCPFEDPGWTGGLGPQLDPDNLAYEQSPLGFAFALGLNTGGSGDAENFMQIYVR